MKKLAFLVIFITVSLCATAQVQNSVALETIIRPTNGTAAGYLDTVTVTIRNMGTNDLDSCVMDYSVVSLEKIPYHLMVRETFYILGGLPSGGGETYTFIRYFDVPLGEYEVCVWVSMPNGVEDSITDDDTLCANIMPSSTPKIIETTTNDLLTRIYPNPTTGELIIDNEKLIIDNVELFDVYGKSVMFHCETSKTIQTIDISHLASGIYMLKINNSIVKKIIKH